MAEIWKRYEKKLTSPNLLSPYFLDGTDKTSEISLSR
jgi:hypothetical protein